MTVAKLIPICFVVLASPCAVTQVPVADRTPADYVTVLGKVFYAKGAPVEGAEVEISTFGGVGGILPQPVHTDKEGCYRITYPPLGDGFIAASKPAEGYPSPLWILYVHDYKTDTIHGETPSRKRIDLKPGALLENVNFVLEHPNPVVTFQVQDSPSGRPIDNARILVEAGGNRITSATVPKDGTYVLVLPNHPIQVTVSAPGRTSWHWKADLVQVKSSGRALVMRTSIIVPLSRAEP